MPDIIDISVKSPDEQDHFFTVKIYEDVESLRSEARRLNEENPGPHDVYEDTMGLFSPAPIRVVFEDDEEKEIIPTELGTIFFLRSELGVGYVTHEFQHAGVYYADVFDLDIHDDAENEELYAWEIGNWIRQFWLEAKPSEG